MRAAGVFLRAIALSSRTCTDVQARLFVTFLIDESPCMNAAAVAGRILKEKPHTDEWRAECQTWGEVVV
jgi:hypothetical protein